MKIVEQYGKYRIVENGVGGFAFEVRDGGKWHRFGSEVSNRRDADIKLSRLTGHRDTNTAIREWEAYYRVNV